MGLAQVSQLGLLEGVPIQEVLLAPFPGDVIFVLVTLAGLRCREGDASDVDGTFSPPEIPRSAAMKASAIASTAGLLRCEVASSVRYARLMSAKAVK